MRSMKSFLPFLAIGAMMEQPLPNGFGNANLGGGSASRDKATLTKKVWQKRKRKLKMQSDSRKLNR